MVTPSIVSLHRSPSAGFEQPFEMLAACHERVDRMLRLLARLRAHLQTAGCDDQARQAARDVMRYFDLAAPAHHEDEARHVFPALLAAGKLAEVVARLQDDHREMAATWPAVRAVLQRVADGLGAPLTASDDLLLDAYTALYQAHAQVEDTQVFPAAAALLDAAAQAAMGEEMSTRRGIGRP